MGRVGGESNNLKYITGVEALTTGEVMPISMLKVNAGPEIPDVLGVSGGGDIYHSCDEAGFYLHFGLDAFGEHAAFGFGFGMKL
ncbi:hypothetical protein [Luteibacter sp. CQ10]|uniref:hypothetical protein n=1 Tax=Luteibacter sp. CQ10 TaxID=2805821 RepID=UPI0034A27AEA